MDNYVPFWKIIFYYWPSILIHLLSERGYLERGGSMQITIRRKPSGIKFKGIPDNETGGAVYRTWKT